VKVLNPHAVGAQEILYQPLVIGGPQEGGFGLAGNAVYRGDSFLCGAALHAGVINNKRGGCGVVSLMGQADKFPSTVQNGIESISFDSSFPLSFSFVSTPPSDCNDLRWPLLAVSATFTSILSVFTISPAVFFGSLFTGIFFHVGLVSDPPNQSSYYSIISVIVGRFLPAAFVAFILYWYCVRPQLEGLFAQYEKTILWVGGCWVGALTNYTFDFIPIQRLTPHDLDQQPGAKAALSAIVSALLLIAIGQIWYLRLEGRLPRYLALYLLFGVTLALLTAIPELNLRIHHYILALLLLPGTAIQTRPSLLYQGVLIGLFINGIARWGFDSILQTPAALLGDGQYNSVLPTVALAQVSTANITFSWTPLPEPFDGLSVLVNDVERFRGYKGDSRHEFTWERPVGGDLPYYFRFGYMQGSNSADYTRAGTWRSDGSWTPMAAGPSWRLL
jgi:LCCL domain